MPEKSEFVPPEETTKEPWKIDREKREGRRREVAGEALPFVEAFQEEFKNIEKAFDRLKTLSGDGGAEFFKFLTERDQAKLLDIVRKFDTNSESYKVVSEMSEELSRVEAIISRANPYNPDNRNR
jgi:hypothetical protein